MTNREEATGQVQEAYDVWSKTYDTVVNRTRDLEAVALRQMLGPLSINHCLEIGCGTGKNTVWLAEKAARVTSVDLSAEMLAQAAAKITASHVEFKQADITQPWTFAPERCDLVGFSLVLEHIEDLTPVFSAAAEVLVPGGYVYVGELHPFKQYNGSKARFEQADGTEQVVVCFNHHVTDFIGAAKKAGLELVKINEFFDNDDRNETPRILGLLFINDKF
jgi:ubiquinone/menaquinone biosynthesis C-methylase UbiE